METTGLLAAIVKYGWIFFSTIMLGLFGWLFRKANDSYTKQEANDLIDLKIATVKQSMDSLKDSTDKSAAIMERLCNSLNTLHTDVAVIKFQVENIGKKDNAK